MNKTLLLFLVFSLFTPFLLQSQTLQQEHNIDRLLNEIESRKPDSVKVMKLIEISELCAGGSLIQLDCISKAQEAAAACSWKEGVGLCYYHMAWHYFLQGNRDRTLENFRKVADYSENPYLLIYSYGFMSNIYSWNGRHQTALEYAGKAYDTAGKTTSKSLEGISRIFLGDAHRYEGKREIASEYYNDAVYFLHNDTTIANALSRIAYMYTLNGFLDGPFYLLQFVLDLQSAYEEADDLGKKMFMISLLKVATAYNISARNEVAVQVELEHTARQKEMYAIGITMLVLMLASLIALSYSRMRTNKKLTIANEKLEIANNELAAANEIKSRLFSILNHDLRRPVAGLISFLELKQKAPELFKEEERADFEQRTIDLGHELLEDMENLLFWSKSQMQSFTPVFRPVVISDLFDELQSLFRFEVKTNFLFDASGLTIVTDVNYLKSILRNLISNAIKAIENTEDPRIECKAYRKGGSTIISVFNNGPSMPVNIQNIMNEKAPKEEIKNGLGLIIIRDLSRSLNCEIKVETSLHGGTTFLLIFAG